MKVKTPFLGEVQGKESQTGLDFNIYGEISRGSNGGAAFTAHVLLSSAVVSPSVHSLFDFVLQMSL